MEQGIKKTISRRSSKESYWLPFIEQWQNSKESSKSFCQRLNLKLDQFNYWRKKLLISSAVSTSMFVKVGVQPSQTSQDQSWLLVELPSKIKISVPLNINTTELVRILSILGVCHA